MNDTAGSGARGVGVFFREEEARALVAKIPLSIDEAKALEEAKLRILRVLARIDRERTYGVEGIEVFAP